jgi:oxygen-independent coproporphyrinogen-3 oxidase
MDQVLELMPDCVTIYQLELTYNSSLYASLKAGRELPLPSWPAKRAMVAEGFRMCEEAGYVIGSGYMAIRNPKRWRFVYTVEHFWHGADLLALGETAFGHLQGVHYQNVDTFERYTDLLQKDKLPLWRALRLRPEEKLRREVILHLKTGQLDAGYFRDKFGVDLVDHFEPQFEALLKKGLLEIEGDTIRLTREGLLEVDWLLPDFYLPEHRDVRYT